VSAPNFRCRTLTALSTCLVGYVIAGEEGARRMRGAGSTQRFGLGFGAGTLVCGGSGGAQSLWKLHLCSIRFLLRVKFALSIQIALQRAIEVTIGV
jgi:hypothetical protein